MKNFKIRTVLLWLLAGLSILAIGAGLLGYAAADDARSKFDALVVEHERMAAANRGNDAFMRLRLRLTRALDHAEAGDAAAVQSELASARAARDELRRQVGLFREAAASADALPSADGLGTRLQAILAEGAEPLMRALEQGDLAAYTRHNLNVTIPLAREFGNALSTYLDAVDTRYREASANTVQRTRLVTLGLAVLLMVALGLLFFTHAYLARYLNRPLELMREHFSRIAAGDLSVRIDDLGRNCVGSLVPYLREMQASLIRTTDMAKATAQSIRNGAHDVEQTNQEIARRVEAQAAALEQTAASMQQLSSTVQQNARNASDAHELASGASSTAHRGGREVEAMVQTMGGISESSQRVGEIIGTIESIAFQTNILALNAAVEAARAGEQGRGFAVVAAEVRALAQKSSGAAREIKALIDEDTARVEAGALQAQAAGATVREMVSAIEQVSALMASISTASEQQAAGIAQVDSAVAQIDEMTQRSATLVVEASAAVEALAAQADDLQAVVSVFRHEAVQAPAAAASGSGASLSAGLIAAA